MRVDYSGFFAAAMEKDITPYPYQLALANSPWPDALKVETGMGKTAAVILAWIHKRLLNDPHTPRRLVYCLPMRVLIEQTAQNAHIWIKNLKEKGVLPGDRPLPVYTLMGGENSFGLGFLSRTGIHFGWDPGPTAIPRAESGVR